MLNKLDIIKNFCIFTASKITAFFAATLSGFVIRKQNLFNIPQVPAYREKAAASVMQRQDLGFFMSKITGTAPAGGYNG